MTTTAIATLKSQLDDPTLQTLTNLLAAIGFGTILDNLTTPVTEVDVAVATNVLTLADVPEPGSLVVTKTSDAIVVFHEQLSGTIAAAQFIVDHAAKTLTLKTGEFADGKLFTIRYRKANPALAAALAAKWPA